MGHIMGTTRQNQVFWHNLPLFVLMGWGDSENEDVVWSRTIWLRYWGEDRKGKYHIISRIFFYELIIFPSNVYSFLIIANGVQSILHIPPKRSIWECKVMSMGEQTRHNCGKENSPPPSPCTSTIVLSMFICVSTYIIWPCGCMRPNILGC